MNPRRFFLELKIHHRSSFRSSYEIRAYINEMGVPVGVVELKFGSPIVIVFKIQAHRRSGKPIHRSSRPDRAILARPDVRPVFCCTR
jgi:hypothetical protein